MELEKLPTTIYINADAKERLEYLIENMEEKITHLKVFLSFETEGDLLFDFQTECLKVLFTWFEKIKNYNGRNKFYLYSEEKQKSMLKKMTMVEKFKERQRKTRNWLEECGMELSHVLVKLLWLMIMFKIGKKKKEKEVDDDDDEWDEILIQRVERRLEQVECRCCSSVITQFLSVVDRTFDNVLIFPPPVIALVPSYATAADTFANEILDLIIDEIKRLNDVAGHPWNYKDNIFSTSQATLHLISMENLMMIDLIRNKMENLMKLQLIADKMDNLMTDILMFGKLSSSQEEEEDEIRDIMGFHINQIWKGLEYPITPPLMNKLDSLFHSMSVAIIELKSLLERPKLFQHDIHAAEAATHKLDQQLVQYLLTTSST